MRGSFDCSRGAREEQENLRCDWRIEWSCRIDQLELAQHSCEELRQGLLRLGCAPLVPVMKAANLRYRYHGSQFRLVHGPRFRRVLGQRETHPGFVIIGHELTSHAAKVKLRQS